MGEQLRIETPAEMIKRLVGRLGYRLARTKGAHKQYVCELGCHTATVSDHPGDLIKSDIRSIIRQTGCTKEEFYAGVKKCKEPAKQPIS